MVNIQRWTYIFTRQHRFINKNQAPIFINLLFIIGKVAASETRSIVDRDKSKQSTPQVNDAKLTKTKLTLHHKMLFTDEVALPPHSLFCILSHQIAHDSILNGSNSTGRQGTSNRTLKILLVTLYIAKNNNNPITVGKAVTVLMKVIHGIEGYSNKVKIAPRKSKEPNLEIMK